MDRDFDLVPLLSLVFESLTRNLGINPVETLQHTTGDWTLRFLSPALQRLFSVATSLFVAAAGLSILAIRMFEANEQKAKTRGIHKCFPWFVRIAYVWLLLAAALGIGAGIGDTSGGIWGASRHALTVGFIATMVLAVGQRILPAFAGMRLLWSPKLMFFGLVFLTAGCTLRVSSEVLAYQDYAKWAWSVLPASALIELTALTIFAINILGTFVLQPSHAVKEPMIVSIPHGISLTNSK